MTATLAGLLIREPVVTHKHLEALCDLTSASHERIQKDFKMINPVVGVSQKMRASGIPADAMTIDCLKSGKRIIIILHDLQPEIVSYQFSFKDKEPDEEFNTMLISELKEVTLYSWMKEYFYNADH
jgi:hypothetical protein